MNARWLLLVAALAPHLVAAETPKDPYAALREPAGRLVGPIFEGDGLAQLTELGDSVGARVTGSPGYAKGAEWAAAQLKAAGAKNVHLETVTLEHGWLRGTATARAGGRTFHVESTGWSPSTPAGGLRAPAVMLQGMDPAQVQPAAVKGKIVIVDRSSGGGPTGGRALTAFDETLGKLKAAGAVALVLGGTAANNVVGTGAPAPGGRIADLPIVSLGREDTAWLGRQIGRGTVTFELAVTNKITAGTIQVPNVIGELPGTTPEWLLIGAHLDSWDFATGTQDNGAGVVQVLQVARALAGAGPLKRSIRFALWAGEEQWMVGSHAYAVAHEKELATCIAALNTDNGAGHVLGWKVEGRKDVKAALAPLAKDLLAGLGGGTLDLELSADTDHFSFLFAGVPSLDLLVEPASYDAIHHKIGDTIDKVDAHALASGAAVVAITAYALATTTEPFAPHLDQAATLKSLDEGYEQMLRSIHWIK